MIVSREINGIPFAINTEKSAGLLCSPEIAKLIDNDVYEFIELLYNKTKTYTPMIATWELTNCCNFLCPFCYINTSAKPKSYVQSIQNMKPAIDDLVNNGLLLVYLTGGEVLSVPDFKEIYLYLKQKGVLIVLLTNLSLLTEEHIRLFKDFPPLRITTSIYGRTKNQFTRATGRSGGICDTVLSNILKIKSSGIPVTCQTPVNQYTLDEILPIADWCFDHGIRYNCSNELTDSYYNESRSSFFVSDEVFAKLKSEIKQIEPIRSNKKPEITKKFGYRYYFDCASGKHTFAVSADLHIRPCFNIWEQDFVFFDGSVSMEKAILDMKTFVEKKRKTIIDGCKGCEASQICGECIYTRNRQKGDLQSYISKKCAENQEKINMLFPE